MIASSERFCVSPTKVRGWFGTMRSSAMTVRVVTDAIASRGFTCAGGFFSFVAPALRGHLQHMSGITVARDRLDEFVAIARVGRGDITIERRLLADGGNCR